MSNCRWFFSFFLVFLLTACNDEIQPKLDLHGHWIVDHGFQEDCQVTASFHDGQLWALTFYSVEEGACQPERYGIENNALLIETVAKKDYFNDDGDLTAELQVVVVPGWQMEGTLRITETSTGVLGSIVSTRDPAGLLEPLLKPDYKLRHVSEDWFRSLRGAWGSGCDPVEAGGGCEVFEFSSAMIGRYRQYERCSESLKCSIERSIDFAYAPRNVEKIAEGKYKLELVIFGPGSDDNPPGQPITLILSHDSLEAIGNGIFYPLISLPVVSAQ